MCDGDRLEPLRAYLWAEMERRSWSMVRLAREAGVSHGTISNLLNHVSTAPSLALFGNIAQALDVPIVHLLTLAGYVPPEPPRALEERQLLHAFRGLAPSERRVVIDIARMLPRGDAVVMAMAGLTTGQLGQVRALIDQLKK